MRWLVLLLLFVLGPNEIIVVSNSIDHSPELISYLSQDFEVISITAHEFPSYQDYHYYVIVGGPDAPEGIGDIVKNVLSLNEQRLLRTPGEYNLFIRIQSGKTFFVLAGSDREQTRLAVTNLKDKIPEHLPKEPIKWIDNLDEALQKAQAEDKLVYIDFYTDWCKYCIQMYDEAYKDPRIVQLLTDKFIPVQLNRESPENAEIVKKYKIYGQPVEMVINADGEVIWGYKGYLSADELYFFLKSIPQNPSFSWQSSHNLVYV